MSDLLSAKAAADMLSLNRETFVNRAKAIRLPYIVLPGGRTRYDRAAIEANASRLTQRREAMPEPEDIQGSAYLAHIETAIQQGIVRRNADGRIYIRPFGGVGNRYGWATKSVDRSVRLLIEQGRAAIGDDDIVRPTNPTGGAS